MLSCIPTEFISAATELSGDCEFASEWKIMDPNRKYIDLGTALDLEFNLPEEEKVEACGGGSDR